jgi:hypothetical protein
MQTVDQIRGAKLDGVGMDPESLFEHAKKVSDGFVKIEAKRLDEEITARHALIQGLKPEQRSRFLEHVKSIPAPAAGPAPTAGPALARELHIPPPTILEYLVLRPPYAGFWDQPGRFISEPCANSVGGPPVGVCRFTYEGRPADGVLSLEAAIGEFFNIDCVASRSPWFIGEACTARAAMGLIRNSGLVLNQQVLLTVEMDVVLDGQPSPWSYYMFPGEPETGLGLVGFLGIATLGLQAFPDTGNLSTETYERFLLGSASAYFPGQVDVKPSFTLRRSLLVPANTTTTNPLAYAFYFAGDLAAFRSIPASSQGNPGYAQANLAMPGSNAALGPSTPLKLAEVRSIISIPWWL